MKKITLAAAVLGMMMGLASCESTTDPKLNEMSGDPAAVSFQINTPAWANQELELNTSADPAKTFDVVVNEQPNYGFVAPVKYTLQASLDGNWTTSPVYNINYNVSQAGEARHTILATQASLADALTALNGFTQEFDAATGEKTIKKDGEVYTGDTKAITVSPVYLRAVAEIKGAENTTCYSNAVKLDAVAWSLNFRSPGMVFLIGAPQGWDVAKGTMPLVENADQIDSKIYQGVFDVPAGSALFRFYSELGNWEANSIGSQAGDSPIAFTKTQAVAGITVVKGGKGSFDFNDWWPGGKMRIVLNLQNNTLIVTSAE